MVLMRASPRPPAVRARGAAALLLLSAGLASCVAARGAVVRAPSPTGVAVLVVLDREDSREAREVPARLGARLSEVLAERNLQPAAVAPGRWLAEFATRRTTAYRLAWLAAQTDAELVLLVETKASFYSALNGRYRWTIDGKATLARRAQLDGATTSAFELPAYLDYEHEREARALETGAAAIAEKVGALADSVLGTLGAPPPALAPAP